MEGVWETCALDNDYEINTAYPYPIRKKSTENIISERVDGRYLRCSMNRKLYSKHRIIATQWLEKPEGCTDVDHINRNTLDNRLENLRWVTSSENNRNRTGRRNIVYVYLDELPEGTERLDSYRGDDLDGYYINTELQKVYVWNGIRYRELVPVVTRGVIRYSALTVEGKYIKLYHTHLF